eukprot:15462188-Alexandrium_andersonii.AAC.1
MKLGRSSSDNSWACQRRAARRWRSALGLRPHSGTNPSGVRRGDPGGRPGSSPSGFFCAVR